MTGCFRVLINPDATQRDGSFIARAGGTGAAGGSLSVALERIPWVSNSTLPRTSIKLPLALKTACVSRSDIVVLHQACG